MEKSNSAVALPSKLALAVGAACALAVREILRRWRLRGTPPGSLGLPVLGETVDFVMDPAKFTEDRICRYGPIFKTGLLFSPTVVLTGQHSKLIGKTATVGWPSTWVDLLGDRSLAVINGTRHKFQRAIINTAFSDEALAMYMPELDALTRKHLDLLAAKSREQGPFDPHPDIKLYTFEVAEKILMGTSSGGALVEPFNTWSTGFDALVPLNLPFTCFGKAMRAGSALRKAYQRIIDDKRAAADYEKGRDILALMMKEGGRGEPMTDEELKDFAVTMMFAGHDTTKSALQTMIHFIAEKHATREELKNEVSSIWDGKSPLTFEQTQSCQAGLCGRFCAEILRVIPPVNLVLREVTEETEIGGYRIPRGWKLMAHISEVHNAQDIDMSVDHAALKQTEYIPFGMGSRMCVGYKFAKLELMVWLMHTLSNYEVSVTTSKEISFPFHYMKVQTSFLKNK